MGSTADEVTPDGSPVAIYLALPAEPSFTPVLERLPAGCSVLDLGCGVGRLTNVLVGRGHAVTAVDESPAMLAHVDPRAVPVEARIEGLRLDDRFDAVVLASHLVNTADHDQRSAFLATARRHVHARGEVHVQHHDPVGDRYELGTTTQHVDTSEGPLEVTTTVHERRGTWRRATTTMTLAGTRWAQHYETVLLDTPTLAAELGEAGLEVVARPSPTWTVAMSTG